MSAHLLRPVNPWLVPVRFTAADAHAAHDQWGANCGPAALAVVAGLTLEQVRGFLGDFEQKGYTNPMLMFDSLRRLGLQWRNIKGLDVPFGDPGVPWPKFGLARVQWCGPWTEFGVPPRVAYRHTHWVASQHSGPGGQQFVFDVNCMRVGGWVPESEWSGQVVPWLLGECEPKANGKWFLTHVIEVKMP